MTVLSLVDLNSIFVPAWKAIGSDQPADAPHDVTIRRVRAIAYASDHCAVCVDSPPYERTALFPLYKSNRKAGPEELAERDAMRTQLRRVAETLVADGFAVFGSEGLEADDVIATLVSQAPPNVEIVIHSSDKDLCQLVGPSVVVQTTRFDGEGKIQPPMGVDAVIARHGVSPEQLGDMLAIVGDPVDWVPGIPGIGEKGATKLLQRFGSLEAALVAATEYVACDCAQALEPGEVAGCGECSRSDKGPVAGAVWKHEMKPAGRMALTVHAEQARLSRELVRLRTNAKIDVTEALKPRVTKPLPRRPANPMPPEEDPMPTPDADFDPVPESPKPAAPEMPPSPPAPVAAEEAPRATVTALAVVEPGTNAWAMQLEPRTMQHAAWLAQTLFDSRVFAGFPTWESCLAAIVQGRELGIPSMAAMRLTHPMSVKGKLSLAMAAPLIMGLVQKSGFADVFKCIEVNEKRATWKGHRKDDPDPEPMIVTYTIEQAQRAGLCRDGSPWITRPEDMLWKTAGVILGRRLCYDVVGGLYFVEELEDIRDEERRAA
jgi:5'-3' exonuclease